MTDDSTDDGSEGPARATDLSYEIDDDESPSEAVILAVATFTNTPILDLDPLYNSIDPDHLDGVFEGPSVEDSSLTFLYDGCEVTVTSEAVHFQGTDGDTD